MVAVDRSVVLCGAGGLATSPGPPTVSEVLVESTVPIPRPDGRRSTSSRRGGRPPRDTMLVGVLSLCRSLITLPCVTGRLRRGRGDGGDGCERWMDGSLEGRPRWEPPLVVPPVRKTVHGVVKAEVQEVVWDPDVYLSCYLSLFREIPTRMTGVKCLLL